MPALWRVPISGPFPKLLPEGPCPEVLHLQAWWCSGSHFWLLQAPPATWNADHSWSSRLVQLPPGHCHHWPVPRHCYLEHLHYPLDRIDCAIRDKHLQCFREKGQAARRSPCCLLSHPLHLHNHAGGWLYINCSEQRPKTGSLLSWTSSDTVTWSYNVWCKCNWC